MASPCEVLVDTQDLEFGREIGKLVQREAERIEHKFSRYRDSVITRINTSNDAVVEVDEETANLLDFAGHCFELSGGRFDITSGVLRRAWRFDGSDHQPDRALIRQLIPLIGWRKLEWQRPHLKLKPGMELDFGGIGKEYAVDRALAIASNRCAAPVLVNLGGDLRISGPRADGSRWRVAIENVDATKSTAGVIEIAHGAIATSGDTHRYLTSRTKRYGHILDPRTGWPIADAPRTVTVAAATCTEAGLCAKLAMLQGKGAENFLRREGVRAWCIR
ncbi:MAG: FAD:protein FMN transferase [Gammaproteobacteria bacterium]|nr:FAD:protein FMN transferase [Gammaproteobacteria bacterium]